MKFLSIRLFEKKLIGRWFVKTKQSQINRVVDLANFDHCGACGSIDQTRCQTKTIYKSSVSIVPVCGMVMLNVIALGGWNPKKLKNHPNLSDNETIPIHLR